MLKGHHTGGSVRRTVAAVAGSQSWFGCCVQRQLQNPELYPPIVVNQALLDDVDGAEDVAMAMLRRRYTESVAQRRLAELPDPEHEPEATAAAADPLVARGLGVGEEPGPDDW